MHPIQAACPFQKNDKKYHNPEITERIRNTIIKIVFDIINLVIINPTKLMTKNKVEVILIGFFISANNLAKLLIHKGWNIIKHPPNIIKIEAPVSPKIKPKRLIIPKAYRNNPSKSVI